ncbi:MAG: hypothetical protein QM530_02600 [Phycisphaerales bacterium]|nr:hypothetical protein [Phycisphaerales bacterium]
METIQSILHKINLIATSSLPLTLIEKDLMLQLTRTLYEEISELNIERAAQDSLAQIAPEDIAPPQPELDDTLADEPIELEDAEIESSFEFEEDANFIEDASLEEFIEKVEQSAMPENNSPFFEQNIIEPESTIEAKEPIKLQELKELKNVVAFKLWNKDIRSYIGINDKYNFISELFGNNAESYEEILNEINLCGSKTEVLQFLENSGITTLYKWDMGGFSVQTFYGVLSQFFATK